MSSGPPQRSHIAQHEKAAIESIQTSATAGPMTGSAASKKHPIFEQLSLANIFVLHWRDDPRRRPRRPTTLGRDLKPGVVGDSGKFPVVGVFPNEPA